VDQLLETVGDAQEPVSTAELNAAIADVLAKASNLSDLQDAAAARSNLGLGSAAQLDSSDVAAANHGHAGAYSPISHDHAGVYEPASAQIAKRDVASTWAAKQTFGEVKYLTNTIAGTDISPANGDSQYVTVSSNTTFALLLENGQSVAITMTVSGSPVIGFGTITWFGNLPTLDAGIHKISFERVDDTVFGHYHGKAV